jgi:hypothetical protein
VQVMDTIEGLFTHMFSALQEKHSTELAAIGVQHPFEPFVMKPMRFSFAEGIKVRTPVFLILDCWYN